jgi:hypothetical protein
MACLGGYAVVDVNQGRTSEGKVLVLLDDIASAQEIAAELCRRGCAVVVRAIRERRPLGRGSEDTGHALVPPAVAAAAS